jgi:hypothetical protein
MPFAFPLLRIPAVALLLPALLLSSCGKKDDGPQAATPDGTVTWTVNGQTYSSSALAAAPVGPGDNIGVVGTTDDKATTVMLSLPGIDAKGAGTYSLVVPSSGNSLPPSALLGMYTNQPQAAQYSTTVGPGATNGVVTVTQYDKANQKLSGTFSFTAKNSIGFPTGVQTATNGTFSFTRFK